MFEVHYKKKVTAINMRNRINSRHGVLPRFNWIYCQNIYIIDFDADEETMNHVNISLYIHVGSHL